MIKELVKEDFATDLAQGAVLVDFYSKTDVYKRQILGGGLNLNSIINSIQEAGGSIEIEEY